MVSSYVDRFPTAAEIASTTMTESEAILSRWFATLRDAIENDAKSGFSETVFSIPQDVNNRLWGTFIFYDALDELGYVLEHSDVGADHVVKVKWDGAIL